MPALQPGAGTAAPGPCRTPARPRAGAASEAGLRLLYRTSTTAGLDLWLERRRGAWEATAGAAVTISGELPSWLEARAAAALERGTGAGNWRSMGAGLVRPQTAGMAAGALRVELRRDPAPSGVDSVTRLRVEQPAEAGEPWLLLSQVRHRRLAGSRSGQCASPGGFRRRGG